jgi:hypothetical protein
MLSRDEVCDGDETKVVMGSSAEECHLCTGAEGRNASTMMPFLPSSQYINTRRRDAEVLRQEVAFIAAMVDRNPADADWVVLDFFCGDRLETCRIHESRMTSFWLQRPLTIWAVV